MLAAICALAIALSAPEQAVFDLTNADRAANNLPPLELDLRLLQVARTRADQVSRSDPTRLTHDGWLDAWAGIRYELAGENLARAWLEPWAIERLWLASEGHRKNILEPRFHRMAIGATVDAYADLVVAEEFSD